MVVTVACGVDEGDDFTFDSFRDVGFGVKRLSNDGWSLSMITLVLLFILVCLF